MEVQNWLQVCDIQGVPAHQLSCGQTAPTIWTEKYCALAKGRLWILEPEIFNQFFSDSLEDPNGKYKDTDNTSHIEEISHGIPFKEHRALHSDPTDSGNHRQTEGTDAQEMITGKNFLQKKIGPSIRRTRSNKQMSGKENQPFADMMALLNPSGSTKQPESDVGTAFFSPTIETPDMLDLGSEKDAIVRPLHHSILGKEHCFEVITVTGSRCFCCKSAGEREAWIEKIKRTLNPNLDNSRRTEHQLNLWVQEAKGIPIKKKYFCEICLDRQLYARTTTKLKDDNTTFWGEHFDFTTIPGIKNITVHLYKDSDKKKKKDKDYVGLVNIPVQYLTNGQIIEKWYTLSTPSGNNKNKSGETMAVRIKARFQSVCVLPMEHYKEFAEYTSKDYMLLCKIVRPVLTVAKKDELSERLVHIMHATGTVKEFMTELVMAEIADVEEESLVFRENTIATKAVEHFLRLVGLGYLNEALGDFVHALYESEEDCEVDGSRLPVNAVLEQNQKNLQMCCEIAMCKIINSIKIFPSELREVFSMWRTRCNACNRPRIASRLITASLFLRLLCPAILNPSLFGLANELPRPNASRTLTLVAKVVQNLANRSRFGDKEEYMKFMNGFVREQWDQMGQFIDGVSDATKSAVGNGFEGFIDLGYELAKLHAFFVELLSIADQDVIDELGALPMILTSITDCVENPPPCQNEPTMISESSKSLSHRSLLDKVVEDAHLSNANDSMIHPHDVTSSPFMNHQSLGERTSSMMDLCTEGFAYLTDHPDAGSETSIPATGSFNNSNNSHRPSPASAEIPAEISSTELNMQFRQVSQQSQRTFKPPLSFSNPTYLRPPLLMRVISSPAPLSVLEKDLKGDRLGGGGWNVADGAVATEQLHEAVSLVCKAHAQPLHFANPLQVLQGVGTSSIHSNSHFETVFTTETVTYTTNMSFNPLSSQRDIHETPRPSVVPRNGRSHLHTKHNLEDEVDTLGGLSSGNESEHERCRSNDSLSSRPSSTSTASTATGSTSNHSTNKEKNQSGVNMIPSTVYTKSGNVHRSETCYGIRNDFTDSKPTAMATSTNISVASALLWTGLQKQHGSVHCGPQTSTAGNARTEITDALFRGPLSSSAMENSRKHKAKLSTKRGDCEYVPPQSKRVTNPTKKLEDGLVPEKAISRAVNVASATRLKMTRKARPSADNDGKQDTNTKDKLQNQLSQGGKWVGNYRSGISGQSTTSTGFPPATPEDPLSPEERTAQWILSNVAPVSKDDHVISDIMPSNTSRNQTKSIRGADADQSSSAIKRLNSDVELLHTQLLETAKSNDLLKQREQHLLDKVKECDRREAQLQERMRLLDARLQKQTKQDTKISELQLTMMRIENEQKREREELQGVIDEKDMIVAAQRRRIYSLEEANAHMMQVIYQLKEKNTEIPEVHLALPHSHTDQTSSRTPDADVLVMHSASNSSNNDVHGLRHCDTSPPRLKRSHDKYENPQSEHPKATVFSSRPMNTATPTASFVNGQFYIGLSSGGSSSSSV